MQEAVSIYAMMDPSSAELTCRLLQCGAACMGYLAASTSMSQDGAALSDDALNAQQAFSRTLLSFCLCQEANAPPSSSTPMLVFMRDLYCRDLLRDDTFRQLQAELSVLADQSDGAQPSPGRISADLCLALAVWGFKSYRIVASQRSGAETGAAPCDAHERTHAFACDMAQLAVSLYSLGILQSNKSLSPSATSVFEAMRGIVCSSKAAGLALPEERLSAAVAVAVVHCGKYSRAMVEAVLGSFIQLDVETDAAAKHILQHAINPVFGAIHSAMQQMQPGRVPQLLTRMAKNVCTASMLAAQSSSSFIMEDRPALCSLLVSKGKAAAAQLLQPLQPCLPQDSQHPDARLVCETVQGLLPCAGGSEVSNGDLWAPCHAIIRNLLHIPS